MLVPVKGAKIIAVGKTKHEGIGSVTVLVPGTDGNFDPLLIFTKKTGLKVDSLYDGSIRAQIKMGSEPDVVWPRKDKVPF